MLTPVVTACGGSDPVNRALVSDPLSIDFSQDGEAIVIRLQNVHDAPVRLTEIEVVENSLVLLHDPLPWRLATNGEAATSVSVNAIAGAQADVIQIRGPNILLRTPVTHPACDFDGDRVRAEACSGDDCDDRNPAVSPTATEVCNGTHDNVNGVVDENLDVFTLYADNNNDRYGDPDVGIESCDQIDGYVENFGDCSDNNPTIDPDADEFCTGIDQNCDGLVDYSAVDRRILYADSDSDGFGNPDIFARACPGTQGYTCIIGDFDDQDAAISPRAEKRCDGIDNDCDGEIDNGPDTFTAYVDRDLDGFSDDRTSARGCDLPDGFVTTAGDCDADDDRGRSPGVAETCDGIDKDCDHDVDEDVANCLPDCAVPITHLPNTTASLRTTTPNILDTTGPHLAGDDDFAPALVVGDINDDG
jgi:hypothetical protein